MLTYSNRPKTTRVPGATNNAGARNVELTGTPSPSLRVDFGQISVHPPRAITDLSVTATEGPVIQRKIHRMDHTSGSPYGLEQAEASAEVDSAVDALQALKAQPVVDFYDPSAKFTPNQEENIVGHANRESLDGMDAQAAVNRFAEKMERPGETDRYIINVFACGSGADQDTPVAQVSRLLKKQGIKATIKAPKGMLHFRGRAQDRLPDYVVFKRYLKPDKDSSGRYKRYEDQKSNAYRSLRSTVEPYLNDVRKRRDDETVGQVVRAFKQTDATKEIMAYFGRPRTDILKNALAALKSLGHANYLAFAMRIGYASAQLQQHAEWKNYQTLSGDAATIKRQDRHAKPSAAQMETFARAKALGETLRKSIEAVIWAMPDRFALDSNEISELVGALQSEGSTKSIMSTYELTDEQLLAQAWQAVNGLSAQQYVEFAARIPDALAVLQIVLPAEGEALWAEKRQIYDEDLADPASAGAMEVLNEATAWAEFVGDGEAGQRNQNLLAQFLPRRPGTSDSDDEDGDDDSN